ncbi:Glycine/D-amino acid oxidase [Fontibacillus panacisegetis]|uniref:Glycine/D-amino acid oxidase n=1 Tax=Fontibacillus panacisegetis TaxID=670482 RepID=A0A1G7PBV6_9BACL|nr:FAD-dependent oxidoreductase [Fontibacillus panacisegetis]SDF83775.1 Glycine/D-amino acid oxidase [Fontibacillus panacisegetis]
MKLHAGKYLWPHYMKQVPDYPTLKHDINCDCLIIGGGIGGALCSYLLSLQGIRAVLVDKGKIAGGSTLASTGLLQYASDKMLTSFIHTFGERASVHFYRLCEQAMLRLKEIGYHLQQQQPPLKIDNPVPHSLISERATLYLASNHSDISLLRTEYENLRKHGFTAEWWNKEKIADKLPFHRHAAIYTQNDAEMDPFAFVHALISYAATKGLAVFENTPITGHTFIDDKAGVICRSRKVQIQTKHVIYATGYETQEFKKDRGTSLTSTYVIVTEPINYSDKIDPWYERCMIWETARPYCYMRTTPDGRILAGGLDERLNGKPLTEGRRFQKSRDLMQMVHNMIPNASNLNVEFFWEAVFGGTNDGLPFIGPHPKYPNCYFLEGYGGNGTVCTMIAAEMITDILTGKPRPDLGIFSLTRSLKRKKL